MGSFEHSRAVHEFEKQAAMNMFVAGAELVRWELTAIRPDGPYRLTMHHARGSIVEYFRDVTSAMNRQTELEVS